MFGGLPMAARARPAAANLAPTPPAAFTRNFRRESFPLDAFMIPLKTPGAYRPESGGLGPTR